MDVVSPGTPERDSHHAALAQMEQDAALAPELVEVVTRVTAAVAEGLSRIVPPGFEVYASEGFVWVARGTARPVAGRSRRRAVSIRGGLRRDRGRRAPLVVCQQRRCSRHRHRVGRMAGACRNAAVTPNRFDDAMSMPGLRAP